tara:strand:+ start:4201 stop:4608 length:408 start_codon:yes stop_codon:yes gene_type:complete
MGKLIHFPSGQELKNQEDHFKTIVDSLIGDSVDTAQHLLDVMDEELADMDISWLEGFNIRDEQYPESRDAFVIVNMIYAMLLRYSDIPHELHKDMDLLYLNIKRFAQKKSEQSEEENEIIFEPDFNLDGDDDDIT